MTSKTRPPVGVVVSRSNASRIVQGKVYMGSDGKPLGAVKSLGRR